MTEIEVVPELKQILGALLFAAKEPISAGDMRRVLQQTAEARGGAAKDFAALKEAEIRAALEQLRRDLEEHHVGVHLSEVAHGFRLENDVSCGPWLRELLERGRSNRLSKPALETLAIIAYRQPVMRSEIESVRGVVVDAILRTLLDLQLIKIVGRSELPGRPWLFGTTQKFLEYFGLRNVKDLPGVEELKRMEEERRKKKEEEGEKVIEEGAPAGGTAMETPVASETAAAGVDGEAATADGASGSEGDEDAGAGEDVEDEGQEADEDEEEYDDEDEEEYDDEDEEDEEEGDDGADGDEDEEEEK